MALYDQSNPPNCTINFPLEFSSEEIIGLASPINTLLKSSYLIGPSFDFEDTFNSVFDIAQGIAGVEACGLLLLTENPISSWEISVSRGIGPLPSQDLQEHMIVPAAIASHFGKAISMDPDWGNWSAPICEAWMSSSLVAFPLRRDHDIAGVLVFGKRESHPFTGVQVKLLWALSMQAENHLQRNSALKNLSLYSFIDPLTHLYNRRYFENQLEKEILRARRGGNTFSLLLIDIDDFKSYNDRFQHSAGDIALQEFAGMLQSCLREVDIAARIGGDEFSVILTEGDSDGAIALAERVILKLQQMPLREEDNIRSGRITVSIGVASFPSDSFDHFDLMGKAELALRTARGDGGGKACSFHEAAGASTRNSVSDLPIRKIFDAGRSVIDMDKFLEILLFTGMQGVGAGRGSIVVKSPEGDDFSLRAAIGFGRNEEQETCQGNFRPGPITHWVVDHQLPLVVCSPADSPVAGTRRKNGYHTDSFLSIPLTDRGVTLGALHLTNKKDQTPFTREDLKAFTPISTEIASILSQGMKFRENVRTFSLSILSSLTDALEMRYPFLAGHSGRVSNLSLLTAERMGLSDGDISSLKNAAILHDVGIVGIPASILSRKRALNDRETELVRKHPFLGAKMLEGIPGMEDTRRAILEHHENFDGSGYPGGLKGDDISLVARILSIAEHYDSIISARPHRDGIPHEDALRMITNSSGTLFDPGVARRFTDIFQ